MTIILISHSIQEAVYLGHRVLVMTAVPGTVKEIVDTAEINDINTKKFVEVAAYLESLLSNDSRREAFRV